MTQNALQRISVRKLSCVRQGNHLFQDLSFDVAAHQALLIEGSNGVGKSSLLRIIAGLASPASGTISYNQANIHTYLPDYTAHIHYLGHANGIRHELTIQENVLLACQLAGADDKQINDVLNLLALGEKKQTPVHALSAGQKRRVALARLWLIKKQLWVLDEPFTALDVNTQQLLQQKINSHVQVGGMCILTSHQPVDLSVPTTRMRLGAC